MKVLLKIAQQRLLRILVQLTIIGLIGQDAGMAIWFVLVVTLWFSDTFYFWEVRKMLMMSSLSIRAKTAGPNGELFVGRMFDVLKVGIICTAYVAWGWDLWIIVPTIAYYLLIDFIIMRINREVIEEQLAGQPPANYFVNF